MPKTLVLRLSPLIPVLLLASIVLPGRANAALIDLTVSGTVTEVTSALLATEFAVGDSMSAVITFDSSVTGSTIGGGAVGLSYAALLGGDYTIGSYSRDLLGGSVTVNNDDPADGDRVRFLSEALPVDIGSTSLRRFGVIWQDIIGAALSDFSMPTANADLAGFPSGTFGLVAPGLGASPIGVFGTLTDFEFRERPSTDVPLPSSFVLLGLGLLLLRTRLSQPRQAVRVF